MSRVIELMAEDHQLRAVIDQLLSLHEPSMLRTRARFGGER
jgi:hypothetical protein